MSTHALLVAFRNKAGCAHTQRQASVTWQQLRPRLTDVERLLLVTAWAHAELGEGRGELDRVCATLETKYLETLP